MLLRECQSIVHRHTEALLTDFGHVGYGSYEFGNRQEVTRALQALAQVPGLEASAKAALALPAFVQTSTRVDSENHKAVVASLNRLQVEARFLWRFLDEILPAEPAFYFSVKVPSTVPDRITKDLGRISYAFDQPLVRFGFEPSSITAFQPGSLWVEISVQLDAALRLCGSLVGLGVVTYGLRIAKVKLQAGRHDHEEARKLFALKCRAGEIDVRKAELELEAQRLELQEKELAAMERQIERDRTLKEVKTAALIDAFVHRPSPELQNVVNASANALAELEEEGAEYRLMYGATEEVHQAFPKEAYLPQRRATKEPSLLPEPDKKHEP